jgi:hypothetical protein
MTKRSIEELDLDHEDFGTQDPKLVKPDYVQSSMRDLDEMQFQSAVRMFFALLILGVIIWLLAVLMMLAPVEPSHSANSSYFAKGGHSSHSTKGSKHHWFHKAA